MTAKRTKIALILMLALVVLAVLVACKPDDETPTLPTPQEPSDVQVTLTVDFGIQGAANYTQQVTAGKEFYSVLADVVRPICSYTFAGYLYNGEPVTSQTLAPQTDFTVTTQWQATYKVEHYLEQDDGTYALSAELTQTQQALLGAQVTATPRQIEGYEADLAIEGTVSSAMLNGNDVTLRIYYNRKSVTLHFDKGLALSAAGDMADVTVKASQTVVLPTCSFLSAATFVGYNTAKDGSGDSYSAGQQCSFSQSVTLYAIWQAAVTQKVWVESFDGTFSPADDIVSQVAVGANVTAANPDEDKYVSAQHADSVTSGTVAESGLTLTSYWALRTFNVSYNDDPEGTQPVSVKYGGTFTVRTPSAGPEHTLILYYTDITAAQHYDFGAEITVTSDITLYSVVALLFTDANGSGDVIRLRGDIVGRGSVTLVRDGTEYPGFIDQTDPDSPTDFDVLVGENRLYGRIVDAENYLFAYASQERGTYMLLDTMYYERSTEAGQPDTHGLAIPTEMLVLDGYGNGVYARPEEGTNRTENYNCTYTFNADTGDYTLAGAMPNGKQVQFDFKLAQQDVHLDDDPDGDVLQGYFLQYQAKMAHMYVYVYNQQPDASQILQLDGYGNAQILRLDVDSPDDPPRVVSTGLYVYANYMDADDPEMVYLPLDGTADQSFYFIVTYAQDPLGGYTPVYLVRHNELGEYHNADAANLSTLWLDGYGGAYYYPDGTDEGAMEGFYTINPARTGQDGQYVVSVTLVDGGDITFDVDLPNRTFSINEDGAFVIDEDGALTKYSGGSPVVEVPEGVKTIASGAFDSSKKLTQVVLPATLQAIEDYAFQNSASADMKSTLQVVVFKSATPPTIGADVFRWIAGNFTIIVPDGAEEAYRSAFAGSTPSQPNGYAQYVTTRAELANRREFEVEQGVLVRYNNKDESPANVTINIPDGVTAIANGVFGGLQYIVAVDLNGVKVIGDNAFSGCVNLAQVTFGSDITSIGNNAFASCALTEVRLGNVQTIGNGAFAGNGGLTNVTMGSVGSLGAQIFAECATSYGPDGTPIPAELVLAFTADVPPTILSNTFFGVAALRIYVPSYEAGLTFAQASGWSKHAAALRVKADSAEVWYSKADASARLEIGDRIMFSETYFGLYRRNGDTLTVSWFEYSDLSLGFRIITNTLTVGANGEMTGADFSASGDENVYVFVKQGTTVTYTDSIGHTLTVTFGSTAGAYDASNVTFVFDGRRMTFSHNGYVYTVTLHSDGTFSATQRVQPTTATYTAADGSTLTITFGTSSYAVGVLVNVDGNRFEVSSAYTWYLVKQSDNVYSFTFRHTAGTYVITITLSGSTFTYSWVKQ